MASAKKLPSGSWRVNLYVGKGPEGKRQYKSFTANTKKQAEYDAAQYALTRKEKAKPQSITVGEAVDLFIEARTAVLSPSTIRVYKIMRKTRAKGLMGTKLSDVTLDVVQRAINTDAQTHAPKSVKNLYAMLSATFKAQALEIGFNPHLPKAVKNEIQIPTDAQVERLVQDSKGTIMETAILLGAYVGMRRSEICALRWDDVDLETKTIRIHAAFVEAGRSEWKSKGPKSFAGYRTVDMSDAVWASLDGMERDGDRVVPLSPGAITHRFKRLTRRLGYAIRFHDLRHYNASVMLSLNVPDKYAMERLGQATPNMLKTVYQHTMKDKRAQVKDAVNKYFNAMQHEMQHEGDKNEE